MDEIIRKLYDKDNKEGYNCLLQYESQSISSNKYYRYFDEYCNMLSSDISYIRVRGFRMICMQAKWDKNNLINKNIDIILNELQDEKPTSVRQCLNSIKVIIEHKKELKDVIKEKLINLNVNKYKESMQGLILKDINNVLSLI